MKIYIGADHRGFYLKEMLKKFLKKLGHEVFDIGNLRYDEKDDYPDFGKKVAMQVVRNHASRGIVICGSGAGVCIAANRIRKARAVLTHDIRIARLSRKDDDTNILCLGTDFLEPTQAKKIVQEWLLASFEKIPKRVRRIRKLDR